jgi:hypothetical protein
VDLLRQILPGHFQRMAALMLPLTESEREVLVSLLQKIVNQASTLAPSSVGPGVPVAEVAAPG